MPARTSKAALNLLSLGLFLLLSMGCSQKKFTYQPTSPPTQIYDVTAPVTLTVEFFNDARPDGNQFGGYGWNKYPCLLPPTPFCVGDYQRPETEHAFVTQTGYEFNPSEDLARAVAAEIKAAGLFREVRTVASPSQATSPLVMTGEVLDTHWIGSRYTYLLGPYDVFVHMVGAPIGHVQNELRLRLRLTERPSGEALWGYEIYDADSHWEWLYYNYGQDFTYSELLRSQMPKMLNSLALFIKSEPPSFWEKIARLTSRTECQRIKTQPTG